MRPPALASSEAQRQESARRYVARTLPKYEFPNEPACPNYMPRPNFARLAAIALVILAATLGLGWALARKFEPCDCYVRNKQGYIIKAPRW